MLPVHRRKLRDDDYIFFADAVTAEFLMKDLDCQVYTIPYKSFQNDHYAIAMPRNSAYMNRINSVSLALTEAGLPDHLLEQNVFRDKTCTFEQTEYGAQSMTYSNFESLLIGFIVFSFICCVVLVVEILIYAIKKVRNSSRYYLGQASRTKMKRRIHILAHRRSPQA